MATNNIPQYLLNHFSKIAKDEGFTEYSLEQAAGSQHGDGFVASMLSVTINGQRKIKNSDVLQWDKLSLICKLCPDDKIRQEQFCTQEIFECEVFAYNELLPVLRNFQEKVGLTEENGFFAYPKCYVATSDVDSGETVIIMKDLRSNGFALHFLYLSVHKYSNNR